MLPSPTDQPRSEIENAIPVIENGRAKRAGFFFRIFAIPHIENDDLARILSLSDWYILQALKTTDDNDVEGWLEENRRWWKQLKQWR